jgi:hypothetical protein
MFCDTELPHPNTESGFFVVLQKVAQLILVVGLRKSAAVQQPEAV